LKTYNIALVTNKLYLQHACVTIISLLSNNKDLKIKFYIISDDLDNNDLELIKTCTKEYRCSIVLNIISKDTFCNVSTIGRHSKIVNYRFLISRLINEDKILYCDIDIVVNGSIKNFYDQDIENYYLAAVEDWGLFDRHDLLNMDKDTKYFNSGVMLLNLKNIRKDNIFEICIKKLDDLTDKYIYPDQDIINSVINGRWKQSQLKYNAINSYVRKSFLKNNYFNKIDILEAYNNPVIIHYTGKRKPWHYKSRHRFRHLYWKYLDMTPFKTYIEPDRSFLNIIKKNITIFFHFFKL